MDDHLVISLFRHGLTEDNKRRAYVGWLDPPLAREATVALELLKTEVDNQTLIITSDLKRCVETAQFLFPESQIKEDSRFREINFGEWEGKTYADLAEDSAYQRWLSSPFTIKPPSGEAYVEFTNRIDAAWDEAIQKIKKVGASSAAIVTHGGVIRYLLTKFAPVKREFWEWDVRHGWGYELSWPDRKLGGDGRCISLREVPSMEKPSG
ncbi:histidine phosphatase family protein [Lederbergia citrea]|uniref:histidine phosphatase family protein n=1 Tax=Lederbergia citrea TaxID=2833581 RepID=UPI001BC94380|nr:histidine phosphatase family protein [Lederbergia citrea]MBS4178021.1 histidine phosphatase family protein [Lederbergia citrea]